MSNLPIATALKKTLSSYNRQLLVHDILAAFVVSLIALPLSMALSIAVGLPPQHGIYTAIVAGIAVPLLGGSMTQVSGPTAAFVVILAPIVSEFGLRGIIWCGIMAGFILIAMGILRLGRLIHYIPYPVTTGFTAGIAVVLATLSLNDFLGLGLTKLDGDFLDKAATITLNLPSFNPYSLGVGTLTLLLLFTSNRVIKAIPSAITAIIAATLLAYFLNDAGHAIETIGSRFSFTAPDGSQLPGIPPYPPMLHFPTWTVGSLWTIPNFEEFRHLLFPALTIAILAGLESLLSATVADSMAGTKHDPNAELTGIGIGNILSGLAAGIPATGAIARTATNINNGGKTPVSSILHAVLIMTYVLLLAPYISYIPMTALAALLIHTAYRMSHIKQFSHTLKIAHSSDVAVLLTCFFLTVFIDMVAGVGVGMICAAFLLMKRVTELTQVQLEGSSNGATPSNLTLPEGTLIYRIRGPLFFGTIEKAFDRYQFTHDYINNFIVDISDVPFIDMTGLVAMHSMVHSIAHEKRIVRIVCNSPLVAQKLREAIGDDKVKGFVTFHSTVEAALNPNG